MARSSGILKLRRAGGIRYRIRWIDAYGERRSETYSSESAARGALRQRQVEADRVRSGLARPRSDKRLAEAAADWLETRPASRRRDDETILRVHVVPSLGTLRLAEINSAVLERFVRHLEGKKVARIGQRESKALRPKTVKNVLILVCKMLGDLGFPQRITYKVQAPSYEWIRRPEDVGRFLDACRPEWFRVAAALAVYTGMRLGEVAGLRREALDFDNALIRVDRSYDGPTKTKAARWVPMPDPLASILRPWLLQNPGPLVVAPGGVPLGPHNSLAPNTRRACKHAGILPVTFHQLRHTAASHLAQRVALPAVGALLGHVSPLTTARYAHLDTAHLARQGSVHLNFAAPSGKVFSLAGQGNGPVVDPAPADETQEDAKLVKLQHKGP